MKPTSESLSPSKTWNRQVAECYCVVGELPEAKDQPQTKVNSGTARTLGEQAERRNETVNYCRGGVQKVPKSLALWTRTRLRRILRKRDKRQSAWPGAGPQPLSKCLVRGARVDLPAHDHPSHSRESHQVKGASLTCGHSSTGEPGARNSPVRF